MVMVKKTGFNSNCVFLNSYSSCSLLLVAIRGGGGPKYFRNLNLPHKRGTVQGSATRCSEPTII